jgi:hypothetical protein
MGCTSINPLGRPIIKEDEHRFIYYGKLIKNGFHSHYISISLLVCQTKKMKMKPELSHRHGRERRESSYIIQKIWASPIDLFLHLIAMKTKVYNDAGRLNDSESTGD